MRPVRRRLGSTGLRCIGGPGIGGPVVHCGAVFHCGAAVAGGAVVHGCAGGHGGGAQGSVITRHFGTLCRGLKALPGAPQPTEVPQDVRSLPSWGGKRTRSGDPDVDADRRENHRLACPHIGT